MMQLLMQQIHHTKVLGIVPYYVSTLNPPTTTAATILQFILCQV